MDYGTAVCDTLILAAKIAERHQRLGGTSADVRAELEQQWIRFAYVAEDHQEEDMGLWNAGTRAPVAVGESATAELEAAVAAARDKLVETERHMSELVAVARQGLSEVQEALDIQRRELIGQAAETWRVRAAELRSDAAEAGDATQVVSDHQRRLEATLGAAIAVECARLGDHDSPSVLSAG